MIGLGTLINCAGIILGGVAGFLFGKYMPERVREGLNMACGITVLFIGISGAMEQMLIVGGKSMFVVICIALGALVGELINIEGWFERFGEWLKIKTGNAKDKDFVNAFVTASLTVCIGAMAIVGSILIFCVGVNFVWGKRVRVANMLPSVFIAAGAVFLPFSF